VIRFGSLTYFCTSFWESMTPSCSYRKSSFSFELSADCSSRCFGQRPDLLLERAPDLLARFVDELLFGIALGPFIASFSRCRRTSAAFRSSGKAPWSRMMFLELGRQVDFQRAHFGEFPEVLSRAAYSLHAALLRPGRVAGPRQTSHAACRNQWLPSKVFRRGAERHHEMSQC